MKTLFIQPNIVSPSYKIDVRAWLVEHGYEQDVVESWNDAHCMECFHECQYSLSRHASKIMGAEYSMNGDSRDFGDDFVPLQTVEVK